MVPPECWKALLCSKVALCLLNNKQEDHEPFLNFKATCILEETAPAAQRAELFKLVDFHGHLLKQEILIASDKLFYPGSESENGRTARVFSRYLLA